MKRVLFSCNTYSQLIMAIHLRLTLMKDDKVSVYLTDQSNDMIKIKDKIREIDGLFDEVLFLETREYCSHKKGVQFIKVINNSIFSVIKFNDISKLCIDEFVFFNLDYALFTIFDLLLKQNGNLVCSRYEEGVLSYNHIFSYRKIDVLSKIRVFFGKRNPQDEVKNFFCMYPELYLGGCQTIKIPLIDEDKNRLKEILENCFDLKKDENSYKEKYIFFTSVYDFEGENSIGEFEVVEQIANVVGKRNILIKQHPRDKRTIYYDAGFKVDQNSSIPWEAIQFHIELKEKILLTVNSGSVLSSAILFKNGSKSYFVFELSNYKSNSLARESIDSIKKVLSNQNMTETLELVEILHDVKGLA